MNLFTVPYEQYFSARFIRMCHHGILRQPLKHWQQVAIVKYYRQGGSNYYV